jgi:hypothetical protein
MERELKEKLDIKELQASQLRDDFDSNLQELKRCFEVEKQ